MRRRFLSILSLVAVALVIGAGAGFALPPSPQVENWNEGPRPVRMMGETDAQYRTRLEAWIDKLIKRTTWNCYNYGVDVQTTDGAGKPVRAHPGKGRKWPNIGVAINAADMCTKSKNRAVLDGLNVLAWVPGQAIPTPPVGQNLVALGMLAGVKGAGADYHWWRLNGDGSWSHKRGGTPAKGTYTDGTGAEQPLTDPRAAAQRDGYDLCCFMGVPKAGVNVGTLAVAPVCTPQTGTVLAQAVGGSGFAEPDRALTPSEASMMVSHLPSFSPSNETSDPHWVAHPAGGIDGFIVVTDVGGMGSIPPYLRAYQGVVEVVRAWPDTAGFAYYNDTNGLESFLAQALFNQALVECPAAEPPSMLTPCQCSDLATDGGPTSTLLSLFVAEPVAEGVQLRWQFGDPDQFTDVELQRAPEPVGPWSAIDAALRDDSGTIVAVDRDVTAGSSHYYRLLVSTPDGHSLTFGPLLGTAGVAITELALAPIRPNPSRGGPVTVDFALPQSADAHLSIVDVQGRLVATLAEGRYGPGRYQASWSGATRKGTAAAGVYFVRLRVGGRTFVRSLVLTP